MGLGTTLVLANERARHAPDRKSTRLNSSHSQISYAVFCLKKKKKPQTVEIGIGRQEASPLECVNAIIFAPHYGWRCASFVSDVACTRGVSAGVAASAPHES